MEKKSPRTLIRYALCCLCCLMVHHSYGQTALSPNEKATLLHKLFRFEQDPAESVICYHQYLINYSISRKVPNWVIEEISPDQLDKTKGKAKRSNSFRPDQTNISNTAQAEEENYSNSGFDKGHMVPAADFVWNQELKDETFFLTNITPQTPDFNQGIWEKLESKIRNYVTQHQANCLVVSGALYQSKRSRGMSENQIAIPSAFYKLVYTQANGKEQLNCFLIPHQFYYTDDNPLHYQVSLSDIEELSGATFFEKWKQVKQIEQSKMPLFLE